MRDYNSYSEQQNRLTLQYNDAIRALEEAYDMERANRVGWNISSSQLRGQYSKQYEALVREYSARKRQLQADYLRQHPTWAHHRRRWEQAFIVLLILFFVGLPAIITSADSDEPASASASSADASESVYWNAETIEIPHLKDSTQYVANPDAVLSQAAVNRINGTLQRLERELGIESVFIVVNHIENDDPFRMAQDVGNKYGVGRDDRGLMVVVGYLDHSINMSPGRKLEADLTDAECHRLEQSYVVPAMRAAMPDSGMIYLAEAVYATLQQKHLPVMPELSNGDDELDDTALLVMAVMFVFCIGVTLMFFHLNSKYHWAPLVGAATLLPNPFISHSSGFYVGGGGGGSFGGGGGFSGGSFGGGSFGGGGATSRW